MTPINIERRCKEETDSIRNRVQKSKTMTPGEKNAILNRLAALDQWSKKVAKQQLTPHYRHAAQMRAKKAVFAALMAGRRVDLTMAAEFQVSQMHTAIAQIRRDIYRKHPDLILCDKWLRPDDGRRPYKQYWLVQKEVADA